MRRVEKRDIGADLMKIGRALVICAGFALSLTAPMLPADAESITFNWSATVPPGVTGGGFPFIGSGTLTATTGPGGDLVTNITGSFTNGIITEMVTGVGPLGSNPIFITDNLIFPIGTTFTGPPVVVGSGSYMSVANLDIHGLAFSTTDGTTPGVFIIASQAQPNTTPPPTGNFYSQVPAGGGFGVGQFTLSQVPGPIAGAGLPGLVAACGGLIALARRRRRQVALN
jgi:hypothetical protein